MVVREINPCHEMLIKALKDPDTTIHTLENKLILSESTLKTFIRDPYYRGSANTEKKILDALLDRKETLFSDWSDWIHNYIDELCKEHREHAELSLYMENLVIIPIKNDPELDAETYTGCRLQWALAKALYHIGKSLKVKRKRLKRSEENDWKEYYQKATSRYKKALRAIENQKESEDKLVCKGKLHLNIMSLMFEQCDEGMRCCDPQINAWLRDEKYLMHLEEMMRYDQKNKMLRHNGLVVAGILGDWDKVDEYANWLLKRVQRLMEPGYEYLPGVRPLAEDPDARSVYDYLVKKPKFLASSIIQKQ